MNAIDLFCGCGGMSKGLTDAGIHIICAIDIWQSAIDNYKKNFPTHNAICADIREITPDSLNITTNIDLLIGSPPCQGFSLAGNRDATDPRNSLFMEFVKYLNHFKPKMFMMENVVGLLSMKTATNEKCIDVIMSRLSISYNCVITKLCASDFEVPQNRKRVIIIGVRKNLNVFPTEPRKIIEKPEHRIPVSTILEDRNAIDAKLFLSENAIVGINRKKEKSRQEGKGFGAQILNVIKPSFTIPARYWKDGYDALVKYDETHIRRLSIVELKRIQTFPDDYVLEGTKKDVIIQIGNAVACRFAYHLGKHIIAVLATTI